MCFSLFDRSKWNEEEEEEAEVFCGKQSKLRRESELAEKCSDGAGVVTTRGNYWHVFVAKQQQKTESGDGKQKLMDGFW